MDYSMSMEINSLLQQIGIDTSLLLSSPSEFTRLCLLMDTSITDISSIGINLGQRRRITDWIATQESKSTDNNSDSKINSGGQNLGQNFGEQNSGGYSSEGYNSVVGSPERNLVEKKPSTPSLQEFASYYAMMRQKRLAPNSIQIQIHDRPVGSIGSQPPSPHNQDQVTGAALQSTSSECQKFITQDIANQFFFCFFYLFPPLSLCLSLSLSLYQSLFLTLTHSFS
jgi:hypothetical protein